MNCNKKHDKETPETYNICDQPNNFTYWRKPKYWKKYVSFIDKVINVIQLTLS